MTSSDELEKNIGITFGNKDLLTEALTHRSYLNEYPRWPLPHNERLEYLGDAVLELLVSEALFKKFPNEPEGQLTVFRAALVNYQILAKVAEGIGLTKFILMSRGEKKDTGRAREVILANAMEALIGAIYLDRGFEATRPFVDGFVMENLNAVLKNKTYKDAKSELQEIIQEKLKLTPTYRTLDEIGPPHKRVFTMGVYFGDTLIADGSGPSKQEAELEAAKNALKNIIDNMADSHFLKRLELNGFKSFAGKTVLEFPAGIVAVVGPNGSGKSNIVDAMRWLLGERDAKNLRGAKVEDLIFAGTQKRARVGMAQASLYFENKNKFFPVDFEEVVVSRQIDRSGNSKYYLNKSEILLRDLIDFFAKARLGSRGLIIIGQGDSDVFIRSSPLERREMIEEILGLREYQIKKADAERRLKNSKINLEKVTALTLEIEPHLRSLKRQTGRWERRGALEEELRSLENTFFGSQLRELGEKTGHVDRRMTAHEKEYERLAKEKRAAETRQAAIEESQPEERRRLAKIKEGIAALMDTRSKLQKDVGRIEAQVEMAKRSGTSAKGGADRSGEHFIDILEKIKAELESVLNEEPLAVQAAIETVLEEIAFALEEKDELVDGKAGAKETAVLEALRREFGEAARDLAEMEKNIALLRTREKELESGQEDFYKAFKGAIADVQQAQGKLDAWEKVNRELLLEKERLDLRRDEVLRQVDQAGRRAEEFRDMKPEDAGDAGGFVEMEHRIFRLRGDLASIGEVDQALVKEAEDTAKRHEFLLKESEDLDKAVGDLTALMHELNEKIKSEFDKSLHKINDEFAKFFALMFDGGSAKLKVLKPKAERTAEGDEDEGAGGNESATQEKGEPTEDDTFQEKNGGVEIEVKLPRKKTTSLDMLSGGERSLVGIAALFAMVSVSPPPFLVLDEIDAPLDERNARRFGAMLKDFSKRTQFIVVTHNRATMEAADILYGVTLAEDGSSKIVSLKLEPET